MTEVFPNVQSKLLVQVEAILSGSVACYLWKGLTPPGCTLCQSFVRSPLNLLFSRLSPLQLAQLLLTQLCSRPLPSSSPSSGHSLELLAVKSPKADPGCECGFTNVVCRDSHSTWSYTRSPAAPGKEKLMEAQNGRSCLGSDGSGVDTRVLVGHSHKGSSALQHKDSPVRMERIKQNEGSELISVLRTECWLLETCTHF